MLAICAGQQKPHRRTGDVTSIDHHRGCSLDSAFGGQSSNFTTVHVCTMGSGVSADFQEDSSARNNCWMHLHFIVILHPERPFHTKVASLRYKMLTLVDITPCHATCAMRFGREAFGEWVPPPRQRLSAWGKQSKHANQSQR